MGLFDFFKRQKAEDVPTPAPGTIGQTTTGEPVIATGGTPSQMVEAASDPSSTGIETSGSFVRRSSSTGSSGGGGSTGLASDTTTSTIEVADNADITQMPDTQTVQPSRIEPYETYVGDYMGDKPSFGERVGGSVAGIFGRKRYDQPTLFSDITVDVSDRPATKLPYQTRGTVTTGVPDLTIGEFAMGEKIATRGYDPVPFVVEDIGKGLTTEYQSKVDAGMDLEKAEEELNKEFEKQAGMAISSRALGDKQTKIDVGKEIGIGVKTGAIVGGLAVAPVATGTILSTSGAFDFVKGSGLAVGGSTTKIKIMGGVQAGLGLTSVGIGTRTAFGSIEKSIVTEQFKELSKQPVEWNVLKLKGGRADLDLITGKQTYGGLTTEYAITGKVIKTGKGGFIMPSGTGEAITSGKLNWNVLSGRSGTGVVSSKTFDIGSKGFTFNLARGGLISGSLGSGTLIPKTSSGVFVTEKTTTRNIVKQGVKTFKVGGDIQKDYFGALSLKFNKDTYYFRSGKISNVNIQTTKPNYIETTFGLENKGVVKIIDLTKFSRGDGVKFISGSGAKSSPGYIKGLYSESPAISFPETLVKESTSKSTQDIVKSTFKSSAKSFGGVGGLKLDTRTTKIDSISQPNLKLSGRGQVWYDEGVGTNIGSMTGINFLSDTQTKKKVGTAGGAGARSISSTIPKISSKLNVGLISGIKSGTKQKQTTKATSLIGFAGIPTIATIGGAGIKTPPPFIPKLRGFGSGFGMGKVGGKQFKQYVPSFRALVFDIKGTKPKGIKLPSGKEVLTGFELRPKIRKKKKSKKKKK